MNKNILLWLIVIGCSLGVSTEMVKENENSENAIADHRTKKLSRQRRYVAFPEGSSFSVSMPYRRKIFSFDYQMKTETLQLI